MPEHRFDAFIKQLRDGSGSRRRALQALAAAVAAGVLPALASHEADASRAGYRLSKEKDEPGRP